MAAWLVAASPTSSLSVLEAERKGVSLLCVFLPQRTDPETQRERDTHTQRVGALVLPNSPQLSQIKLLFSVSFAAPSGTHNAQTAKTRRRKQRARVRQKRGYREGSTP